MEINIFLANRQMPQGEGLAVFKEPGAFLPATAPDRIATGRFDVTFDFVFGNLNVQDPNFGKIQQLLELNLHCDALTDECRFMTTISWGISRQLPKSQKLGEFQ
jgi:hypothetical protein